MAQQRMQMTASCSGRCRPDVQLDTCRPALCNTPQLWSKKGFPRSRVGARRRHFRRECRAALPELFDPVTASRSVLNFSRVLATSSPAQIRPVIQTLGSDLAGVVSLKPTLTSIGHLAAVWYAAFAQPSPIYGILDFYFFDPIGRLLQRKWTVSQLSLRDRMGSGNYGQVFEGVISKPGQTSSSRLELSSSEKKKRVVLKRVNLDKAGIRSNFLATGTQARGAGESGQAEAYMCQKIMRSPFARGGIAKYLGTFVADATDRGFTRDTQWLIWKYESDTTLAEASQGVIGDFPGCMAEILRVSNKNEEKQDAAVVRTLMRKLLTCLSRLHALGTIHRDIKPENVLVTSDGALKIIDFGAAVDLCTGINFNPMSGMLDPKYSPPEELVLPQKFPRAPLPALSALLAPLAWQFGRPDLFDAYSAGVVFMQLAVPELRPKNATRNFNNDLANADYDLDLWRKRQNGRVDLTLLDRNNKAGWQLARKLICKRNILNRGRLSVGAALRHRYFWPEF